MSYPFRRILCPIDFDHNSLSALDVAAQMARDNDGMVLVCHVVPMVVAPTGMPVYVDIYKGQEEAAREKLREIGAKRLSGLKYELLTHMGEPAGAILRTARRHAADLIVMATHGRRGFTRVLLGSVAEMVLREAPCPVLCVRPGESDKNLVGRWMSSNPVTAAPDEKLSSIQARMHEGDFRSMPVVKEGRVIGLITDRHLRMHAGYTDQRDASVAMTENPTTVTPGTPLQEAARIISEQKLDSLPVIEDGKLAGVLTTSDVMRAFMDEE